MCGLEAKNPHITPTFAQKRPINALFSKEIHTQLHFLHKIRRNPDTTSVVDKMMKLMKNWGWGSDNKIVIFLSI